jgi:hypothetical protein
MEPRSGILLHYAGCILRFPEVRKKLPFSSSILQEKPHKGTKRVVFPKKIWLFQEKSVSLHRFYKPYYPTTL